MKLARDKKLFEQVTVAQLRQNLVLLQVKEIEVPRTWLLEIFDTIEAQQQEIEQLQQWVNDLQSGMYVNCVYCGHRYEPAKDTPVSMADVLKKHIEQCPKHPMSTLKQENEQLRAQLAQCREVLRIAREDLDTWHSEAFAYQDSTGGISYRPCSGCCTCEETLPAIDKVLEGGGDG
jgi:hypothetical protein